MQSSALKLNNLLEHLEKEDYEKAVSYIEFLIDTRKKEQLYKKEKKDEQLDVEEIVSSLVGVIPDTGKTLEEYREERLKKYEITD